MASKNRLEKQKIEDFISHVPFAQVDKDRWLLDLSTGEGTQELLNDLHEKLIAIPPDQFASDWMRLKFSTDLANLGRQWRLSAASKQFSHRK